MRESFWRAGAVIVLLLCMACLPAWAETPVIWLIPDTSALDLAFIQDKALVTNLNYPNEKGIIARYTGLDLGEVPTQVTCRARFVGGGSVALVVTPSSEWSVQGITERSIHAVFTSDGYHFGFFEDGILTDVLADGYTLDTTGETEYTFGFAISGNTITLQLPTGKKVKKRDDRVVSCGGTHVIFEHYVTAEEAEIGAAPVITYLYAKGKALPAAEDDFQRPNGLPVAAPTGHTYVQFRNE